MLSVSISYRCWFCCVVAAGSMCVSGCGWVGLPDLYHPGPAGYQRARGIQHDPYPLDDVAEPVVGGRPREYQRPVPAPERAVQFDQRQAQAAGAPGAPAAFAPAPVVGAPPASPYSVPPLAVGSPYAVPSNGPYGVAPAASAPAAAAPPFAPPLQAPPYQYTAPVPPVITAQTSAPYQLSIPATPPGPAPYPYGAPAPAPVTTSPIPQFRPPY